MPGQAFRTLASGAVLVALLILSQDAATSQFRFESASARSPRNRTCAPHVVFTSFACPEHECSVLRRRIENNTRHVWSAMEGVEFLEMSGTPTNQFGVPVVGEMYARAMDLCRDSRTFTYMNGDILGTREGFVGTVEALHPGYSKLGEFLMVGRRTNVPWSEAEDYDATSRNFSFHGHFGRGKLFLPDAEDYFTVTRGAFDWKSVPRFVVGRVGYDNWLVQTAYYNPNVALVDATATAPMMHQTDERGAKARGTGSAASLADLQYNNNLVGPNRYAYGKTLSAEWETFRDGNGTVRVRHRGGGLNARMGDLVW